MGNRGLNRIKAVLFDFDGTLADTHESIMESMKYTMKTCLGMEFTPADMDRIKAQPLIEQLKKMCPDSWEDLRKVYLEHYIENLPIYLRLFPGAREILDYMRGKGIAIGIVTSKMARTVALSMDLLGLDGLFRVLVCAEDVRKPKPDPEGVLLALDTIGVTPPEAIMVGDSPYDIRAGRAAGTATAAALWGEFPSGVLVAESPDIVLDNIADLRDYFI